MMTCLEVTRSDSLFQLQLQNIWPNIYASEFFEQWPFLQLCEAWLKQRHRHHVSLKVPLCIQMSSGVQPANGKCQCCRSMRDLTPKICHRRLDSNRCLRYEQAKCTDVVASPLESQSLRLCDELSRPKHRTISVGKLWRLRRRQGDDKSTAGRPCFFWPMPVGPTFPEEYVPSGKDIDRERQRRVTTKTNHC